MVIQMLEMKLVGKCEELECYIIVYRPFQQFMRIKAHKQSVNKGLFWKPTSVCQTNTMTLIPYCAVLHFFLQSDLF